MQMIGYYGSHSDRAWGDRENGEKSAGDDVAELVIDDEDAPYRTRCRMRRIHRRSQ